MKSTKPTKVRSLTRPGKASSSITKRSQTKSKGSLIRNILEFIFFLGWLICTGVAGYFTGLTPFSENCPPTTTTLVSDVSVVSESKIAPINDVKCAPDDKRTAYEELKRKWTCSRAEANYTQVDKQIFPREGNYDKTKWKSIITVEPKAFFDKYLNQYPGDTKAIQPVVVFSHKPLQNMKELPEVCKVMDVAIVPDLPGVCVAVTETYHDVASYHMLHASKQQDGSFALASNSINSRKLPDENAYASARALLLEYFKNAEYVNKFMKNIPHYGDNRVAIGCLIESIEEATLFKNSVISGFNVGISNTKFVAITTSAAVKDAIESTKVKVIFLPDIASVGTQGSANVGYKFRRYFLQAWLAFCAANNQNKVMWQSPGTIWLDRPDNIVNAMPIVETLWSFRGRQDIRAAPFFVSFDFFTVTYAERSIHLMHELLLHFDLVLAWESLDAVTAYRLSENNSRQVLHNSLSKLTYLCRYGTTTHIIPPYKVLHANILGNDPVKIKEAVTSTEPPMAIVVSAEDVSVGDTEKILRASGLWVLTEGSEGQK